MGKEESKKRKGKKQKEKKKKARREEEEDDEENSEPRFIPIGQKRKRESVIDDLEDVRESKKVKPSS